MGKLIHLKATDVVRRQGKTKAKAPPVKTEMCGREPRPSRADPIGPVVALVVLAPEALRTFDAFVSTGCVVTPGSPDKTVHP